MSSRLIAPLTVVTALLGAPSTAEADGCMCAAMEGRAGVRSLPHAGSEAGPTARPSPRPAVEGKRGNVGDERVLWCIDGSDPRCAPAGDGGSDAPQVLGSSPVAGPSGDRHTGAALVRRVRFPHELDGPHRGVRSRVERPPRDHRRAAG